MKKRIFRSMCIVSLLCVLFACICVTGVLYKFSFDSMRSMIRDEAVYIVAFLNSSGEAGLNGANSSSTRITLIDPDGTVVYDSEEAPEEMENHSDRPEISGALNTGAAEAQRYSSTLSTQTYYRAVRLDNGQVVRVSGTMDSVWITALRYLPLTLLTMLISVALSAVSAGYLAGRIATPINNVNLDDPLSNDVYEELSPLLRRMEHQRQEIDRQLKRIETQRLEFEAITVNMREGLVLLGKDAEVLSINRSAMHALNIGDAECVGQHILYLNRDEAFQKAVAKALKGLSEETVLSIGSREYQLMTNPVADESGIKGTVLLLLDVTDRQQAEKLRREFTANVSHELKTPLTSISGFAEIIKDGLVKQEDIPQFSERIYNEARRLITLVEDIIRLSRLDEKSEPLPMQEINLLHLSQDVAERLETVAKEKDITISVSGCEAVVMGVPHILEEMVTNLCDNGIKYNKNGGYVKVLLEKQQDSVILSVSDNGIGIPKEHESRIFERFYRVDKSHSKETGGTGLGLSIVKHCAIYHGATLELESEENVGTVVRVKFCRGMDEVF